MSSKSDSGDARDPLRVKVESLFAKHEILPGASPWIVGVSGGVDSTVLLHVLEAMSIPVYACHVNYQLRGEQSDGDEHYVRSYCKSLLIPVDVYEAGDELSRLATGTSVQDRAREIRYDQFAQKAVTLRSEYVAVAHNRDDQAETALMHLARGTGLTGAAGMAFLRSLKRDLPTQLIRPLLYCSRAEIEDYAHKHELSWREDVSNSSGVYRRSRVRNELRPVFEKVLGPSAWDGLASSTELLQEIVADANLDLAPILLNGTAERKAFSISVLKRLEDITRKRVIRECIRVWTPELHPSRAVVEEISALIDQQVGSQKQHGRTRIIRERDVLRFLDDPVLTPVFDQFLSIGKSIRTPVGFIRLDELLAAPESLQTNTAAIAFLDLDRVGTLRVRTWQAGDHLSPFAGTGTQNVSDLLTHAKVPTSDRERHVVVVDEHEAVLWLPGVRAAESCRVSSATKRVGILSLIQ